jgi:spore coat polysaccharide biosynthesis protein SpsF (cytidylyltransferase family)
MVGMAMGHEHMAAFVVVIVRHFQLPQDAIAAAGIGEKETAVFQFQEKTGVKAFRGHGKASA